MINQDELKIRSIVKDEILKNYQSGTPIIPPHKHNGTDNLRVSQSDIISNTKFLATIQFIPGGTQEIFTFNVLSNPTQMTFNGFIRYPASGTVTRRTIVNGIAQFGTCYSVTQYPDQILDKSDNGIVQCCNFFAYTVAGPATTVGMTPLYLVYDTLDIAKITVTSWTNKSVTMKVDISGDASIIGNFIIT